MKKRRRCPTCGRLLPRRRKKFCDVWCQRNVNAIAEPEPPSEAEIAERAAEIRQGWSNRMYQARASADTRRQPVVIPVVRAPDIALP